MEYSTEQEVVLIADSSGYSRFMVPNRQAISHAQVILAELTKVRILR